LRAAKLSSVTRPVVLRAPCSAALCHLRSQIAESPTTLRREPHPLQLQSFVMIVQSLAAGTRDTSTSTSTTDTSMVNETADVIILTPH